MILKSKLKNILYGAALMTLTMGLCAGCGQKNQSEAAETESSAAEVVEENVDDETNEDKTAETTDTEDTNVDSVTEVADETDASTGSSFGLKDFDGFYYTKVTEEMDGFEYTYIYGYRLNPDGTGMYYGQENVEITWNETEIHKDIFVNNYDCEPGKLIVHEDNGDVEYDKLTGNFINPNPYDVDVNTVDEGTYPAYISKDGISENDGKLLIMVEIFTEDTYDIVDIGMMAPGDILYIDEQLIEVSTIDTNEYGLKEINGGIEEGGTALISYDDSNCYVYAGMDGISTFTSQGIAALYVNSEAILIDERDPGNAKEYSYSELKSALEELVSDNPLTAYTCTVRISNHEIVEINRFYTP